MDRTDDNEIRWIKFGCLDQLKNIFFVGKDVVAVHQSFYILFLRYKNEEKSSPKFLTYDKFKDDHEVDGITCVAGHEGLPMFATAMSKAQIQLFSYPAFAQVKTLENKSESIQALSFSNGEILAALSCAPNYALAIWNWLSGKKLITVITNVTSLDQKITCFSSSPILISQASEETNELTIWEVSPCYNTCHVVSKSIELPNAKYYSSCWTPDGVLWVINDKGDIYYIDAVTFKPMLFLQQGQSFDLNYMKPCIGCFKSNLIVTTENGSLKIYKKCNGKWSPRRDTFEMKRALLKLKNSNDCNLMIGWNCVGELLKLEILNSNADDQQLTTSVLTNFGISIYDICLINPDQSHFCSINNKGLFQVWETASGELVSTLQVEGSCMTEHPFLPVIAMGSDCGTLHFFNISDVVSPRFLGSIFLDQFIIDNVLFDHSGVYAVAGSLNIGKFFILQMSSSSEIFYQVTHYVNLEREMLSIRIISSSSQFFLAILNPPHQLQDIEEKNIECLIEESITVKMYDSIIKDDTLVTTRQEIVLYKGERLVNRKNWTAFENRNQMLYHATLKLQPLNIEDEFKERIVVQSNYYSDFDVIDGRSLDSTIFYVFPTHSQIISIIQINTKDLEDGETAKVIGEINTGHLLRCCGKEKKTVQIVLNSKSDTTLMTFGADGLVLIYNHDIETGFVQQVNELRIHHYVNGGVRKALLIPLKGFLLSLGWDGCTISNAIVIANYKKPAIADKIETDSKNSSLMHLLKNLPQKQILTLDLSKSWMQLEIEEDIKKKREECKKEKASIYMEFEVIKSELITEIEKNMSTNEKIKLPLSAFDLNRKLREENIRKAEMKRKEEELTILNIIKMNEIRSEELRRECWSPTEVKGKCIKAIKGELEVENYTLMPEKADYEENIGEVIERRVMEIEITFNKLFTPWIPKLHSYTQRLLQQGLQTTSRPRFSVKRDEKTRLYMTMMLEADETKDAGGTAIDIKADFRWSGSISHKFVNVPECLHKQQLELAFNSSHNETIILEYVINLLRKYFNNEFKKTEDIKKQVMSKSAGNVSKLHNIISEHTWCSNAVFDRTTRDNSNLYKSSNEEQPTISSSIVFEPKWNPQEIPECSIMDEGDSEANVPGSTIPDEGRRKVLRRTKEDFHEEALMKMMDGVLEKCWVDEIKRDIPRPTFMETKSPDEWSESEIKLAKEYELKIEFLNGERERYRKILVHEFEICNDDLMGELLNFDKKLLELHKLKLQIDASLAQENMKIMSMQHRNDQILLLNEKEDKLQKKISEIKEKIESSEINMKEMRSTNEDCGNVYESRAHKDRQLERSFGKENDFSAAVSEQRNKSFRQRPKVHLHSLLSMALILEMWRISGAQGSKPIEKERKLKPMAACKELLPWDAVEYLHTLNAMDASAFQGIDDVNWANICKWRRAKIQSELKLKISAEELGEVGKVIEQCQMYMKSLHSNREKLQEELNVIYKTILDVFHDAQIQLILRNGMMEIDKDTSTNNFSNAILIHQLQIDTINEAIKDKGKIKLRSMQDYADFRRTALLCEWEHKKMRMEMKDLHHQIKTLESTMVTKDMLAFLCSPEKEDQEKLEKDMNNMKELFGKKKNDFLQRMDDLNEKIFSIGKENKKLDKAIQILSINISEQLLKCDPKIEEKATAASNERMAAIVKRSHLITGIQKNYNEIIVLQTELEILRLKTFPTFRYTSIP